MDMDIRAQGQPKPKPTTWVGGYPKPQRTGTGGWAGGGGK